jgi:hypothetical protein
MLSAAAVATAIAGLGILYGPPNPARAGDDAPPSKGAAAHAALVAEIQRELKADDVRLCSLANEVLEDPSKPGRIEDQLDRLRIDAIKAEGEYEYAKNRREIAEMALKEYVEAILPHDLVAAERELSIAQTYVVEARNKAAQANEGVEKISAKLEEMKAGFSLEQAESKKKVLVEYTKSHRTKDLETQIKKARSDELGKQAEWELLKSRIKKTQGAPKAEPAYTDVEKRIVLLLDRAAPVEERVQARFRQLKQEPGPDAAAEKEVRGLLDQLGAIIDEAEAVKAAADFDRVKPRLRKRSSWFSSGQ